MPASKTKPEKKKAATQELESLEGLLRKLPEADQKEAFRILYGDLPDTIPLPKEVQAYADQHDFEVAGYTFPAAPEQRRPPRRVRIGVIQNKVIRPTTDPVVDQYEAIADRVEVMLEAAGKLGVNVVCLQEAWTMPFAFCTREKTPWLEFAEPIDGPSTQRLAQIARRLNMVIVSPILENQCGHLCEGRDIPVFVRLVLQFHDLDLFKVDRLQLALGAQKENDAVRVRRERAVIKLHGASSSMF